MEHPRPNLGSSIFSHGSMNQTSATVNNDRDTGALFVTPAPEIKAESDESEGNMSSRRRGKRPVLVDAQGPASKRQRPGDPPGRGARHPGHTNQGPREIVNLLDDDDGDDIQLATPAPKEQPAAAAAVQPIDLENEKERYELKSFSKWVDKDRVYAILQRSYAKIFRVEAKIALPGSGLMQRMEEIAEATMNNKIEYLIDRDESTWSKILKKHETALSGELEQVREMRDQIKRKETQTTMNKTVIKEVKQRYATNQEHLEKREKIVKELKIFVKID
ncbi:hypothetical protein CLAFUR4_12619 [Fulvia fulva]|nr:hypothetical protein CLAFUR4_12619 [Fulvia fulva]